MSPVSKLSLDIDRTEPREDLSNANQLQTVDSLLGLAKDMWPTIHKLSYLISMQDDLENAGPEVDLIVLARWRSDLAKEIAMVELDLHNWEPNFGSHMTTPSKQAALHFELNSNSHLKAVVNNAEAYRHAAFVHLHRQVKQLPRDSTQVQFHVRNALTACLCVVACAGPMSALLWPMFIAACEAIDEKDREVARVAFREASKKQGMLNIGRAWNVVLEVWDRSGDYEGDVCWRQVCWERNIVIILG